MKKQPHVHFQPKRKQIVVFDHIGSDKETAAKIEKMVKERVAAAIAKTKPS